MNWLALSFVRVWDRVVTEKQKVRINFRSKFIKWFYYFQDCAEKVGFVFES
jgi:hypothetical protein